MFQIDVMPALHLRLLQTHDAAALFALTNRNREYLRQWLPWLDKTRFESDSDSFIRSTLKAAVDEAQFTCGLWHEGALCGVIGFNEIDRANHAGTLGYWLDQAHTGRGLMTKSVRALIQHAFTNQNLNRIVIKVATANHRSQAIPDRLGFTREGILREAEWLYDHHVDLTVNALLKKEAVASSAS